MFCRQWQMSLLAEAWVNSTLKIIPPHNIYDSIGFQSESPSSLHMPKPYLFSLLSLSPLCWACSHLILHRLLSIVFQNLLLMEFWAQPWACGSPALWRASRRRCQRPSRATSKPKCLFTVHGHMWSEEGDATRASGLLSTSPMTGLLKMVRGVKICA